MTTGPATSRTAQDGLPRGTTARTARIAALPLAFTGRAVAGWGRRLAGADPQAVSAAAMERNAEQLFAVLGQLRGGAMKVGQALAVYESMMPAELAEPYRRALVRLQAQGPAMPARDVHRVLDEQLGRQWRTRLPEFDDVPAAAASIGQVHRARTAQGRPVAVKVQYPGADQALETDLRVLERFARLFTLIVPGLDARAVMRELRARTLEELDYRAEADRQRRVRGRVRRRGAPARPGGGRFLAEGAGLGVARRHVAGDARQSAARATTRTTTGTRTRSSRPCSPHPCGWGWCTPTRTPATSCCCTTAGWAWSTSARPRRCPAGSPRCWPGPCATSRTASRSR